MQVFLQRLMPGGPSQFLFPTRKKNQALDAHEMFSGAALPETLTIALAGTRTVSRCGCRC